MNKKVILKRIFHRGKSRILISFKYDPGLTMLIRQVPGNCYSSTYNSWYVDDEEEKLKKVLRIFREKADIDISDLTQTIQGKTATRVQEKEKITSIPENIKQNSENRKSGFQEKANPTVPIKTTPIDTEQTEYIDSIHKAENTSSDDEIIPGEEIIRKLSNRPRFNAVEFRIKQDGRLAIKFTGSYDKDWIREIKSFGNYCFDEANREFLLPWSVMTSDSLSDYFASRDVEVIVIKPAPTKAIKNARREMGNEIRSRKLGEKALKGMDLMKRYLEEVRYSARTNESYATLLELFFKYFHEKDPQDISMDEASEFVYDFIVNNGYSSSYQNQMISAIKTFYRISGKKKIELHLIERPRRSRSLPKVFSKEEVKRILNSTRNTKHKLLLWMIYSCGLRRSEVTNILLTDLDHDRSVLHIREGKGRVDRIVPVSSKVWDKIDEYIDGFHPVKYLFEGQKGGKYSVESVCRVFKDALHNAGIKKDVGVHSLRHSYATHLHETGLDIRYIQELLGHKSTRTTEIYTHVSRRNLIQVRSPIEDMDVK